MTDLRFASNRQFDGGGIQGFGRVVVNFLSEWCEVEESRQSKTFRQSYCRGIPTGPVEIFDGSERDGTKIRLQLDREIFQGTEFSYDRIREQVEELAFLCAGVSFAVNDERTGRNDAYCYEQGVADFVEHVNQSRRPLHADVISLQGTAVIAVRLPNTKWEGCLRFRLGNAEAREAVESALNNYLPQYFAENPRTANAILRKLAD